VVQTGRSRAIHKTVNSGAALIVAAPPEIGLGNATAITQVELVWPASASARR
jgi:hypothetical protein